MGTRVGGGMVRGSKAKGVKIKASKDDGSKADGTKAEMDDAEIKKTNGIVLRKTILQRSRGGSMLSGVKDQEGAKANKRPRPLIGDQG